MGRKHKVSKLIEPKVKTSFPDADWLKSYSGAESIDYQRSSQITWWSILQGLSVAALIEKIPNILIEVSQNNRWYLLLFLLASFLGIVNIWVSMAWGIMIYRWPINLTHAALLLLVGTATYLFCLYVDNPAYWCLAIAFLTISTIIVYNYNIKNRVLINLPVTRTKTARAIYVGYTILSISASLHMLSYPSAINQTIWGFIVLAAVVTSLIIQTLNMRVERQIRNIP